MNEIVIPLSGWPIALAEAVKTAPHGATIVVNTQDKAELGIISAGKDRLNRPDLIFEVREDSGDNRWHNERHDKHQSEDEDVYWVNEDCVEALALRRSDKLSKETLDKLFAWEEKVMRGRRGEWYERLPGMADANGVCDATGLGAPRVCIFFEEALAKDAEAARSGRKTGQ